MIVIYLNCILLIYIAEKCSLFILSKDEILVKNTPTSLHEKKRGWRQWTLILIFCVDVHMEQDPPPPESGPFPPPCGRHTWMVPYVWSLHLYSPSRFWVAIAKAFLGIFSWSFIWNLNLMELIRTIERVKNSKQCGILLILLLVHSTTLHK